VTSEQARELVLDTFGREDPGDDAWTFATAWTRQFSAPAGETARRDEIACAFAAGRDYAGAR
jgi:hypothetical protein